MNTSIHDKTSLKPILIAIIITMHGIDYIGCTNPQGLATLLRIILYVLINVNCI